MHTTTLAQTTLIVSNLRPAQFWAEMDAGITRAQGTVSLDGPDSRYYQLPTIELCVSTSGQCITASWLSQSPVVDARVRNDLCQSAEAWLAALSAITAHPAPVSARVQAASALLAGGFESVAVSSSGGQMPMSGYADAQRALAA